MMNGNMIVGRQSNSSDMEVMRALARIASVKLIDASSNDTVGRRTASFAPFALRRRCESY